MTTTSEPITQSLTVPTPEPKSVKTETVVIPETPSTSVPVNSSHTGCKDTCQENHANLEKEKAKEEIANMIYQNEKSESFGTVSVNPKLKDVPAGAVKMDYLEEDDPIAGQKWFTVSFISPEGIKNCKLRIFKIRGVYETRREADEACMKLREKDKFKLNIFVAQMGKWLEFNPDPNNIKDQKYVEKEMNDMVKAHLDSLEKSKRIQEDRIKETREQVSDDKRLKRVKDRLRKQLRENKRPEDEPEDPNDKNDDEEPTSNTKADTKSTPVPDTKTPDTKTEAKKSKKKKKGKKSKKQPTVISGPLDEEQLKAYEASLKREQEALAKEVKDGRVELKENEVLEKETKQIMGMLDNLKKQRS
jgi:hypothetical protein